MEAIAIIGIGCRFPGGASNPDSFWNLLKKGKDAIINVPENRWDSRRFYDPDPERPAKMHTQKGGFLKEPIDRFDPLFFGISPREAEGMDPQQRILLEVTWEAFEDAGLTAEHLDGSNTAVVIGGFCMDNTVQMLSSFNRPLLGTHDATGSSATLLSNRISYCFNLTGPSFTVDTACSSSMVALHYACEALRSGRSQLAVAGGVNIMLRPEFPIAMGKGKFLSNHGYCKTFDQDASGYARGEGAGVAALKPLSKALSDGDRIYAVIRASGVRQDGRTVGIALPNSDAQARLIREVCNEADVAPSNIAYVEAHGTGTQAGDCAELAALDSVLSKGRSSENPYLVGSVKTNMGHLEAAAGIAGLIKTALVLHHQTIPPNLHFNNPNPEIPFHRYKLQIPTKPVALPLMDGKAFASVNSFGYGGTIAHAIIEAWPQEAAVSKKRAVDGCSGRSLLIPLSARSSGALKNLIGKYALFATREQSRYNIRDIVYNTTFRRSHHNCRAAIITTGVKDLKDKLRTLAQNINAPAHGIATGVAPDKPTPLAFVYTGMGPQWWGMGRDLKKSEPIFAEIFSKCDDLFKKIAGWSIIEVLDLGKNESRIGETQIAQPANFILQAALTELLKSWGIQPAVITGHSIGEVGAAYASGALSLEEALLVTFHRSRLQQSLAGQGSMLAASVTEDQAGKILQQFPDVSVGAYNSPGSLTFAGPVKTLQQISVQLDEKGIFNRLLKVEVAYHSSQMEPILSILHDNLQSLRPKVPTIPVYSTVTGELIQEDPYSPNYWTRNVREPVRFAQTIGQMLEDGVRNFLQIGPHPVLSNSIQEAFLHSGTEGSAVATLVREEPERDTLLGAIANLYCLGYSPGWEQIAPRNGTVISLPSYPWQREQYWKESELSRQDRLGLPGHPLLNERANHPLPTWQVELNSRFFPYLPDHRLQNNIVFPGALYVEAGLAIHSALHSSRPCILKNLRFSRALVIEPKRLQQLALNVNPQNGRYTISSRYQEDGADWQNHAEGVLAIASPDPTPPRVNLKKIRQRLPSEISTADYYKELSRRGLHYGPRFRVMQNYQKNASEFLLEISLHPNCVKELTEYRLYPTILDGLFQAVIHVIGGHDLYLPVSIAKVIFHRSPGSRCFGYGKIRQKTINGFVKCDLILLEEGGGVLVELRGAYCQPLNHDPGSDGTPNYCYQTYWKPEPLIGKKPMGKPSCLIFARTAVEAKRYCAKLHEWGLNPYAVLPTCGTNSRPSPYKMVRPNRPEDFHKLFQKFPDPSELFGIIYLWNFDPRLNLVEVTASHLADSSAPLAFLANAVSREVSPKQSVRLLIASAPLTESKASWALADLPVHPLGAFGLTLMNETQQLNVKHLTLNRQRTDILISELVESDYEQMVTYHKGNRMVNRLGPADPFEEKQNECKTVIENQPVKLTVHTPGNLESLAFVSCRRQALKPNEVEIQVDTCALNYKDLLKILGRMPVEALKNTYTADTLGIEVIGTISRVGNQVSHLLPGGRVVAISPGGFQTYARVPACFAFSLPGNLPLEAPHILVAYLTAYYGLIHRARLGPGERVLIHSATGGLGLAAINVARAAGAEIFATAGSQPKRRYLHKIGIRHIYDSRNLEFVESIRKSTKGKGVDVVLNTLTGEGLRESLDLLAPFGRFIEAGKRDIIENGHLPMRALNRAITVCAIDTDRLLIEKPLVAVEVLQSVLQQFEKGIYSPPPHTTFAASEVDSAFRLMAKSDHIGKIAIRIHGEEIPFGSGISAPGNDQKIEGACLITGGLNGFGLETACFLANKGALNLILASRRGNDPQLITKARSAISAVNNKSRVAFACLDVTNLEEVQSLFHRSPPIRNIFHCAAVLDDCHLKDLTTARLLNVLAPKVTGAWNLIHAANLTSKTKLKNFVLYSSISSLVGNPGQGSYVLANAYLDALACHLSNQGYPAVAINWGGIGGHGMLKRNRKLAEMLEASGMALLPASQALDAGWAALCQNQSCAIADVDWDQLGQSNRAVANAQRFSSLINGSDSSIDSTQEALRRQIIKLKKKEQHALVTEKLLSCVSQTIKLPTQKIPLNANLTKLGIDSLSAIELILALKKEFGILISTTDLLKDSTVADFSETILKKVTTST